MPTMKEFAHLYISKGYSVIPVGRNKIPLINWKEFQDRIASSAEVDAWFEKWPDMNIGIVTGKVSNLTVVDVEKGGDITKFPSTTTVKTGGGGFHFYYKYCESMDNKARILPLTDIRGNGGYVVAVPSVHASGNKYEIASTSPRVDFPVHIFGGERKKVNWQEILSGVGKGSRNETAASLSGKLLQAFAPSEWEGTAWIMLKNWNMTNQPPLSDYELRTTYESIARREVTKRKLSSPTVEPTVLENRLPITFTDVLKLAENELDNTRPEDVVSFGYDWLDNRLTGFFKGELVVLGGETGSGKSTFATNIIMKASKKHKCMMFALEDRLADYGIKAIYFELGKIRKKKMGPTASNYPWNEYRKNAIKDEKYKEYRAEAVKNLENGNVFFFDAPETMNIDILEQTIKQKVQEGVELFLVDHLHYFDFNRGDDTKADYIEKMMVRLRRIQAETGARILLIVHYKKLDGKKPSLDSFKDSISIVQNANYVINIHRDRGDSSANRFETVISIPKARNPNGEATLIVNFNPDISDYEFMSEYTGAPTSGYAGDGFDAFRVPLPPKT